MGMTRKEKSKIIYGDLMQNFDWLYSQESALVSVVMDSLKKIENIDKKTVSLPKNVLPNALKGEDKDDMER